jgi:glycerophosphoryl diester phosphodiesterase
LIIGHRGASALAPENTLVAFKRALDDGADGLEFDVHLAADGVPVVIHDDTLRRTGLQAGKVADLTSKELTTVDVGSWFNRRFPRRARPEYTEAHIPTLEQVLELCRRNNPRLYIELKGRDAASLAESVCRLVAQYAMEPNAVIESFDHRAIVESKRFDSAIRTAALFEPTIRRPKPSGRWLGDRAEAALAYEVALHYSMAGRKVVAELLERGFRVVIWTADKLAWVDRARRYGIHAIITNDPKKLLDVRC